MIYFTTPLRRFYMQTNGTTRYPLPAP